MTELTEAQRALLTSAAARDNGDTAELHPRPTINALIKRGYLISVPKAGGPSRLIVTAAGRVAVGLDRAADNSAHEPSAEAPMATAEPVPRQRLDEAKPATGKIPTLVSLLRRPEGARIDELMAATGWQAHSVRGALSGAIKKNLALAVISEKADGVRTYRIAEVSQ